jgi:hypothetical protein
MVTHRSVQLRALKRCEVSAEFIGGEVSSDNGVLLLRQIERRLGCRNGLPPVSAVYQVGELTGSPPTANRAPRCSPRPSGSPAPAPQVKTLKVCSLLHPLKEWSLQQIRCGSQQAAARGLIGKVGGGSVVRLPMDAFGPTSGSALFCQGHTLSYPRRRLVKHLCAGARTVTALVLFVSSLTGLHAQRGSVPTSLVVKEVWVPDPILAAVRMGVCNARSALSVRDSGAGHVAMLRFNSIARA